MTEEKIEKKIEALLKNLEKIEIRYTNLQEQVNGLENNLEDICNKPEEIIEDFKQSNSQIQEEIKCTETSIEDLKNQLGILTSEAQTYKKDIENKITELDTKIEEWMDENTDYLDNKKNEIKNTLESAQEYVEEKQNNMDSIYDSTLEDFEDKKVELTKLVKEYESNADISTNKLDRLNTEAINSNSRIKQIEADSTVFKETIDEYIENMQESTKNINKHIADCQDKTAEIFEKNDRLTESIEEQLQKATGISLFHTFQKRKEDLEKTQNGWLAGIIVSILILIGISIWVMVALQHIPTNTPIDWFKDVILKFALSSPAIYMLCFFTDRYAKTRRLVEEYAFKSTISLALKPYFDLVKGLDGNEEEKDKNFLIAVIGSIFTTPTDKVFRTTEKQYTLDFSSYYKSISDIIKPKITEDNQES